MVLPPGDRAGERGRPAHPGAVQELNRGKPYADQIKPQNFMLSAQVALLAIRRVSIRAAVSSGRPLQPRSAAVAQAALDRPLQRQELPRDHGRRLSEGVVRIKTYRDVVLSTAATGAQEPCARGGPCSPTTKGSCSGGRSRPSGCLHGQGIEPPRRRTARSHRRRRRSHKRVRRPEQRSFVLFVVPVLKSMHRSTVAKAAKVDVRTLRRNLSGDSLPQPQKPRRAHGACGARGTGAAYGCRVRGPARRHGRAAYLRGGIRQAGSELTVCGREVTKPRAMFCGPTCRKRAARCRSRCLVAEHSQGPGSG